PVPRAQARRRRQGHRAGRHLLPAGGVAARAVIWSVSVDLDGLACYAGIHGLPPHLDDRASRAVPEVAVERFCELFAALRVRAYLYDSSLLPSPPYYAAKAAALAVYALRGRRSESILGGFRQLFAPRKPHRRRGLRELPIATLPLLRAPVIGTTVLPV